MALSTYTELQASVASWLNRTDLTPNIPDFIALAESSIGTDVRLRDQIERSTLTTVVAQGYVSLPSDWLEFVEVKYQDTPLICVSNNELTLHAKDTDTAIYYSIQGDRMLLAPTPNAVVSLDATYYAKIPALSVTPTNVLLTKYPQIYLTKALAWAFKFMMNTEKAAMWETLYKQSVSEATSSDEAGNTSGAPLRIRTR